MVARVRHWLDIRPGEGWPVLYTALYICLASASFLLAKPIRNGLFLQQFGPYKLVYVYVGVPLLLAVFVPLYDALARRVGQRAVVSASLAFFLANVLGFWWGFLQGWGSWLAAAFYLWVNCYGVIAPVQAWSFANAVFDTRQARRLFGAVGAGGSLGAMLAGLLARSLVGPLGTVNLLLVLAGLIAAAIVVVNVAWPIRRRAATRAAGSVRRQPSPSGGHLKVIAASPYLRAMALLVALVAIVTLWTGFQLNVVVADRYGSDADGITRFMGTFNLVMGIVSFAMQVLVTGPLLRRFGLSLTLMLLPLALTTGSLLTVAFPLLWAVVLTNSFDQGLRFSIDRSSFELLYLPLSPDVRRRAKSAIELVVNRVADAVGGLVLGLATQGFALGPVGVAGAQLGVRGVAAMTLVAALAWTIVAWRLRGGYLDAIRESIHGHQLDVTRVAAPILDRSATDVLAAKLATQNPDDIVYALDLLALEKSKRLHPAVRELLAHPEPAVRRRALAVLDEAGDTSVVDAVRSLLRDDDPETRTEALLFLAHHAQVDPLREIPDVPGFPAYSIQAGMIGYLCRLGASQNIELARFMLDNLVDAAAGATAPSRIEAARLLATLPVRFDTVLERLLGDEDAEVRRAAIHSVARARRADLADAVLPALLDAPTRDDAAKALASLGEAATPVLSAALGDESHRLELRSEIPTVLARIGTPAAARALADHLLTGDAGLRTRILDALADLQRRLPTDQGIDRDTFEAVLTAEILGHYRSYQILGTIRAALAGDVPIAAGLHHSIEQERDRIFRLVSLLSPGDDVTEAYDALHADDPAVRANALELLDNVLPPHLRRMVMPLVDPLVSFDERIALANRLVGAAVESQDDAVRALLASDDTWLRAYGVHALGALRLEALAPDLDRLVRSADPLLLETIRAARRRLEARAAPPPGMATELVPAPEETGVFHVQYTPGVG